jgi:hypothetical protein
MPLGIVLAQIVAVIFAWFLMILDAWRHWFSLVSFGYKSNPQIMDENPKIITELQSEIIKLRKEFEDYTAQAKEREATAEQQKLKMQEQINLLNDQMRNQSFNQKWFSHPHSISEAGFQTSTICICEMRQAESAKAQNAQNVQMKIVLQCFTLKFWSIQSRSWKLLRWGYIKAQDVRAGRDQRNDIKDTGLHDDFLAEASRRPVGARLSCNQ